MSKIEKIKTEGHKIRREVNKKLFTYMTAGIGLVVGLAWNDAIKTFIEYYFPLDGNTLLAKFIYALVITIGLAIFSYYLNKILIKEEEEKEKIEKK